MAIIESEERTGALILRLQVPRMDAMQASVFKQELIPYASLNRQKVILDLSKTEYLDSSSLGVFRKFAVDLSGRGGRLILCNLNHPVAALLRVSRMEMLFEIAPDLQTALDSD